MDISAQYLLCASRSTQYRVGAGEPTIHMGRCIELTIAVFVP